MLWLKLISFYTILGGGLGGRKESGQLRFGCRDRPFRKPIPLVSRLLKTDECTEFYNK